MSINNGKIATHKLQKPFNQAAGRGQDMLKRISIVATLAVLGASIAYADSAFGIVYGGELPSGAVDVDDGYFTVSSPPKPHSLFELYMVKYTPETGVCRITAGSENFENDKYGNKVTVAYDKLVKTLDKKYGPNGDSIERLNPNALWDEADEFAMSLVKGDRTHGRWFEPSVNNKEEFDYVEITIDASDSSTTYITLVYQNRNLMKDCSARISASDNDSL